MISRPDGWAVETSKGSVQTQYLITCGGLHADRLVRAAGRKPKAKIVPFRGEYYQIKKARQFLVRHLIYPVPDPKFPFLGVHFTRLIHGGIEAGPNAVLAFAREGYKWTHFNPRDLAESLFFPGLWKFLAKYPSMCGYEIRRSLSRAEFCRSLQKLVPGIQADDLEPGCAGVRAQAMLPDGRLVEDFHFEEDTGMLHVVNAPSPAATASLAIGAKIAGIVLTRLNRSLHYNEMKIPAEDKRSIRVISSQLLAAKPPVKNERKTSHGLPISSVEFATNFLN